jgi:hypothetical protein
VKQAEPRLCGQLPVRQVLGLELAEDARDDRERPLGHVLEQIAAVALRELAGHGGSYRKGNKDSEVGLESLS